MELCDRKHVSVFLMGSSPMDRLNVQILGNFTVPNTVAEEKETSLRKIKRKPSISKSLPRVLEASLGSSDPPSADSLV